MDKSKKRCTIAYAVIGAVIFTSGCSRYRVMVQGVDLDHFTKSRRISSPDQTVDLEAARHNDLGVFLEQEGNLEAALKQYRIAQQKDPDLAVAYINAGNVCVKLNNLAGAIYYYQAALKREPEHPQALNNLAWVCILKGENLPYAIALLDKAIRADPAHRYRYLDSRGWALYQNGRTEEALKTLQAALEQTPEEESYLRGETHYHLGLIYHARQDYERASFHLEKCLELNPPPEREKEIRSLLCSDDKTAEWSPTPVKPGWYLIFHQWKATSAEA